MSRKGNCHGNATMESFWSALKLELICRRDFATRAHSALDYHSPVDFELQYN